MAEALGRVWGMGLLRGDSVFQFTTAWGKKQLDKGLPPGKVRLYGPGKM